MNAHELLKERLEIVAARQRRVEFWVRSALCWAIIAVLALCVLIAERKSGLALSLAGPLLLLPGIGVTLLLLVRQIRARPAWRRIARLIEGRHPQLEGRLLTAVQQAPAEGQELNYLQERLLLEALEHDAQSRWAAVVPKSRLVLAQSAHWVAVLVSLLILGRLPKGSNHSFLGPIADFSVQVTPGDTMIERGNSLVVLARFAGTLPPKVDLVLSPRPGDSHRVALVKSLADPIFGGSVPELNSNLTYHLEYGGERTRDFRVKVFEYPRLERADIDVTFPKYTGLAAKRIENTRRLSAVEGSRVELTLQLNKWVASARLVAKDKDRPSLPLVTLTNESKAVLKDFTLLTNKTYELVLVDDEGRTNKVPDRFIFEALKNRPPEFKLTSPRGDLRPSPLEEISFEGTVWDDFGVRAYGLAYTIPGQETRYIEMGSAVPANQKRPFQHILRLEDLGLKPDDLVAWFPWADDIGPDGQVRRTSGDLFFAEVRPFDEVFREGQSGDGGGESQQGGGQGGQSAKLVQLQKQILSATWNLHRQHGTSSSAGGKGSKTPDSQPSVPAKEPSSSLPSRGRPHVARAANRVLPQLMGQVARDSSPSAPTQPSSTTNRVSVMKPRSQDKPPSYAEDATVVRDSQAQALEQAEAASGQGGGMSKALWEAAVQQMERALARLNEATNSPAPLPDALAAEQAAYQALLKLQEHEYQVTRNRNRSQRGGGNQAMERQLEQMDLTQSESRYETQRQAQSQNNERREQLQVTSRLQELARRQQDLNDRLKELQTALQEAKTEQEREEIRRRLKRLQEEEQQMLADVDELRQRMDRPENQSRMADERQQLEQTRQDIQRAAEASSQGSASSALAAGTRAQRQLQQMRDQMRKANSSQFADDLRQMRSDARELSRQQEEILKQMGQEPGEERRSLSDQPRNDQVIDELTQQKQRLTNLVERATQTSQQAEDSEPLLSRELYDTVRKFTQETAKNMQEAQEELLNRGLLRNSLVEQLKQSADPDGAKLLDMSSEMLREGYRPQANSTAQRARGPIDELKRGVELAAESVLGDDTEALRMAGQELDQLTSQLEREMAQANGNSSSTNQAGQEGQDGQTTGNRPANSSRQQASNQGQGQNQPGQNEGSASNDSPGNSSQSNSGRPNSEQANSAQGNSPGSQNANPQSGSPGGRQDSSSGQQSGSRAASNGTGQQTAGGTERGPTETARTAGGAGGGGGAWRNAGGGGEWLRNWDRLIDDPAWQGGPITGGAFGPWADRLRDVEEMVEAPDLRNQVATARERARLMRQDFKRDQKKPDWAVVRLQVMKPLLEVRARIADELARRQSNDALVPIDRDPVPTRYSDLVRRYYEELGKQPAK